jgi:ABC-type nitrate/sulfonate/bicarbonate transport system permease component
MIHFLINKKSNAFEKGNRLLVRPKNELQKKLILFSQRIIPVLVFLLLWEFVSRLEVVNPRLFPQPTIVWSALVEWFRSGELWRDIKASYWRMLVGYFLGGFLGVSLGMLTGRNRLINRSLSPLVQLLRPLPPVAIIPLIIVWLGIGDTAKIFSISFAVFFPVWINTHLGASSVAAIYLWSAQLLCRSKFKIAMRVLFPAVLPSIVAGLRTAIAIAFIMVYVSEIAGASAGIGYQISVTHLAYRIDKMMAALLVLASAGAFVDFLFAQAIRLAFPWTNLERKV